LGIEQAPFTSLNWLLMDPQQIPKRSKFWFRKSVQVDTPVVNILDWINLVCIFVFALLSFIIFWPIISKINFEEAFFTPLVPFLISLFGILKINAQDAIRILFITSFIISTVGIYLLVYDLTKRRITSILASIVYLVPPMPILILSFFFPRRYESELISAKSFFTIIYGDGANFLALALIALAALSFLRFLKCAKGNDLLATVSFCTLILLASRSQALNLFLVLLVVTLTELFLGCARVKIKRLLLVLLISLGLVSFWYTPGFWRETLLDFFRILNTNLKYLFPLPLTVALLALFVSFVFFARRENRQPIFLSFLLFIIFLILVGDWLTNGRSLLPHPQRLIPNLNMFAAIVVALSLTVIVDSLHIAERIAADSWSIAGKVLGALVFGVASFILLAVSAFILSPWVISLVSVPNGIWIKIKTSVLADRQETLVLAGRNFELIRQHTDGWQLWLGIALSLVFIAILIYVVSKDEEEEG